MLFLKIGVKVNGFYLPIEIRNLATDFMHINGDFDQTRFSFSESYITHNFNQNLLALL